MFRKKISKQLPIYSVSPIKVCPITPKIKKFETGEERDNSAIQIIEQNTANENEKIVFNEIFIFNEAFDFARGQNAIIDNINVIKQDTVNENEAVVCAQDKNEIKDNIDVIEQATANQNEVAVSSQEKKEIKDKSDVIKQNSAFKNELVVCSPEKNEMKDNTDLIKQDNANENNTVDCPKENEDITDDNKDWIVFSSYYTLFSCYIKEAGYLYLGKNKYKNKCTNVFSHDDIIKLRGVVGSMPYRKEKYYCAYYSLPVEKFYQSANLFLKDTQFMLALRFYVECAFLGAQENQDTYKFRDKLYAIKDYFIDFPNMTENIELFLKAIEKYERNYPNNVDKYFRFVENHFRSVIKLIKMEDLIEKFDENTLINPVFPPPIKNFNSLFFAWIYESNLGMYFTNLVSAPILRDTLYMRTYKRFLWVFQASLLNAIPNKCSADGHLLNKMAYKIQDTNEYLAAEFVKKAVTVFRKCNDPIGKQSIDNFFENLPHMNNFKDFILEEDKVVKKRKSIFKLFRF